MIMYIIDIIYGGREGKSFLSYEGAKEVGVEFFSVQVLQPVPVQEFLCDWKSEGS